MTKEWVISDLPEKLEKIGIYSGSSLFIHSHLGMLGIPMGGMTGRTFLSQIKEYVGERGNIFLPAFTYSFPQGKLFNPTSLDGLSNMGALTLAAMEMGFNRSMDPIFSILGTGVAANDILDFDINSSFGGGSSFYKLLESNVKLLTVGIGAGSTILHEMERQIGVNYRFDKTFKGKYVLSNGDLSSEIDWNSYVRLMSDESLEADFTFLTKVSRNEPFFREVNLGRGTLASYDSQEMFGFLKDLLEEHPYALTKRSLDARSMNSKTVK